MPRSTLIYLIGILLSVGYANRYGYRRNTHSGPYQGVHHRSQGNTIKKIDITELILQHGKQNEIDLSDYFYDKSDKKSGSRATYYPGKAWLYGRFNV